MRYIITRDGTIIDLERVVDGNKLIHLNENEIKGGNFSGWYWKTGKTYYLMCRDLDVIKQFNTIEELCDEFVIKVNVHNIVVHDFESALNYVKDYKNNELTKDYIIYGAIWTDKGLIFVARMNSEGVLELL